MLKKCSLLFLVAVGLYLTLYLDHKDASHIVVHAKENIIQFEDSALKSEIQKILGKSTDENITADEAMNVKKLDITNKNISNLQGIEYFKNLKMLKAGDNQISDLSPLQQLNKIDFLILNNNRITDLGPLSNLSELILLNISDNDIKDVTPLANLIELAYLYFTNNDVSNISSLNQLKELDLVEFSNNHIADISILEELYGFRHGIILNQTIQLPEQIIKKGSSVQVENPIKDKDGAVKEIQVRGGDYDEAKNMIVWENINESQTLTYTFNKVVNIAEYADVEFSGTVSVTVKVLENKKPTLAGVGDKMITLGQFFNPLEGVSAFDEEDGDLTNQIQIAGTVDSNKAGIYDLTYSVTDSIGETTTAKRMITVAPKTEFINQIPSIDAANRIIKVGESFDPLQGVTAFDEEDGNLTDRIEVIVNTVDNTTPGTYDITYRVVDTQGAEATLTIMVMVRDVPQTGYQLFLGQGILLLVGAGLILCREKRQS